MKKNEDARDKALLAFAELLIIRFQQEHDCNSGWNRTSDARCACPLCQDSRKFRKEYRGGR